MKKPNIIFYYGSSCFGKSTLAIKQYIKYKILGYKPLLIHCPCTKNDLSRDITSRVLGRVKCMTKFITLTEEILETSPYKESKCLIFDEIQNKPIKEIELIIRYAEKYNKKCILIGALFDNCGRNIISTLEVIKLGIFSIPLKAKCDYKGCKEYAFTSININKDNKLIINPAISKEEVKTLKLCRKHFHEYIKKDYKESRNNLQI